ncbi:hypothetical protein ABL78_2766 [Leptomonas seymouri]|uniref:Uncharacterized protein n=1 Tax=Leptomonas seymouri TaxID=5684 RepID=A0A0N1PD26_LEPSE|nr:hypothetical protein ABL78_2766 [Leptomonas seymouri]|eukprot:KPI88133.1 hypothetical protein ABL78_2766 [Leptomonas seymouri]
MDAHMPTSSASRNAPTRASGVPAVVVKDDDTLHHTPVRVTYRDGDDTLPSPPAPQQVHSFCLSEDAVHGWTDTTFSGEQLSPPWLLQDTVTEKKGREGKGRGGRVLNADSDVVHTTQNLEMHTASSQVTICVEANAEWAAKVRSSPLPEGGVVQRSSSGSPASSSPEAIFNPSQQPTTLPRTMQAALRSSSWRSATSDMSEKEKTSSSSSNSTSLICVPLPAAWRSEVNAPSAQQPVEECTGGTAAAEDAARTSRSQRRSLLVSPAMADDSPGTNSWTSPRHVDNINAATLHSSEPNGDGRGREGSYTARDALDGMDNGVASEHYQATSSDSASRFWMRSKEVSPRSTPNAAARRGATLTAPLPTPRSFATPPCKDVATDSLRSTLMRQPATLDSSVATTEEASPVPRGVLQRLRLQLNQAERAASLHQALYEAAQVEKADLQLHFDELLRIQSELERRSQRNEAALAEAERRHAAEKLKWEVERQNGLAQLQAAHDAQLQEGEVAAEALRAQIEGSNKEIQALQSQLTVVRAELHALMEEHLVVEQQLLQAQSAQTAAEELCASLRLKAEDTAEAEQSARAQGLAAEALTAALREASERMAVSELAFHTVRDQLAVVLKQQFTPLDSCEVSALSTSGCALRSVGDRRDSATITHKSSTTESALDVSNTLRAAMSEEVLAAVVDAALSQQSLTLCQLDFSSQTITAAQTAAVADRQADANPFIRPQGEAAPAVAHVQESSNRSLRLSAACRAYLKQRRQEVQGVLRAAADSCRRVAREEREAADARAAVMERALSTELQKLQSQVAEQQRRALEKVQRQDAAVDVKPTRHDSSTTANDDVSQPVADQKLTPNERYGNPAAGAADIMRAPVPASAADLHALNAALSEAKHALAQEQRHAALLRKDVDELHQARYVTTVLTKVEETLKDMHQSIAHLLRDAVDDMQSVERMIAGGAPWPTDTDDYDRERGRWRRIRDDDMGSPRRSSAPAATTVPFTRGHAVQVDKAVMRSVQKAALLAEAQVERVGEELLGEARRGRFADAGMTIVLAEAYPTNGKHAAFETGSAPSRRGAPTAATSPRSEKQQLVYEDMKGLLHRWRAESGDVAQRPSHLLSPPNASVLRYSPDGSRWMAGIRPPPQRTSSSSLPSGSVATPARQCVSATASTALSPYVRAYVHSLEETSVAALPISSVPTHHHRAVPSTLSSATALRVLEEMAAAAQGLRNVGDLLEMLQEEEETREERRQACLLKWEGRIARAVDEGINIVRSALKATRPPNIALELFQRNRRGGQGSTCSVQTPPRAIDIDDADGSQRQQPQARLANVLSGVRIVHEDAPTATASSADAMCCGYNA